MQTFALACIVFMGTTVDARQNLGRLGNIAVPVDLTNADIAMPPLKPGHGIQVNHGRMSGEKRLLSNEGGLSTEVEIGLFLQD